MQSYLKWVGNKTRLFPEIYKRFPQSYNNYHEPFLGSAAIYLNLILETRHDLFAPKRKCYIQDINKHLINCHVVVASRLDDLISELNIIKQREIDEPSLYADERRKTVDDFICGEDIAGAARFIYLNKRSYGGMWRENKDGMFNVPKCETQDTSFVSKKFLIRLQSQSKILREAAITHGQYDGTNPQKGDLVFLDPPYYPISKSSNFTSYAKDAWTPKNHDKLFEYLKKLDAAGIFFIMTNNDVEYIRKKSEIYNIERITVTRFIDALKYKDGTSKDKREHVNEMIIRNF